MRLLRPERAAERDDSVLSCAVARGDTEAPAVPYDRHAGWPHALALPE
ncbi:hypothetical protein [Streptomyces sp. NPDC046332]